MEYGDRFVLQHRGAKNSVDSRRAYAIAWEEEPDESGALVPTSVVFLTNRECPFRCVMCDLWKHTLDQAVPRGAIAHQIRGALSGLPPARHIKLYNAGSFFDPQQIPPDDDEEIAATIEGFDRVIVESHPAFLSGAYGERCRRFQAAIGGRLEVAIGLETANPDVLARLNKRMTLDAFRKAADFLHQHDIALRVFVLLNPPFLEGPQALESACRSLDVAVECGATVCSVIPTRGGNGAMEALGDAFVPARLPELETVIEYGLRQRRAGPFRLRHCRVAARPDEDSAARRFARANRPGGSPELEERRLVGPANMRVFADLWDVERFFSCDCSPARAARLTAMNREQRIVDPVVCACDSRH